LGVLINDNYWQTECGWIISCNFKNLYTFPSKPGSATKPSPGFQVEIISAEDNTKMPVKGLGKVCIKLPMPPSFMLTLYNNDQAFINKYLTDTPGYYTTGDAGYFDEDGYLNVMTRLDDIINTAGHRLSTAHMEEELMTHPAVSEAAVVAKVEELKG
jgi:propionyl-CoA synthetase